MDDVELEPVRSFLNRIDADLACGALQAAGIEAVVSADDAGGTRPHLWTSGVVFSFGRKISKLPVSS